MTNYNSFAKTFSNSRKKMKWEEIDYFLDFLHDNKKLKILDIGCGNGRFLGELIEKNIDIKKYLGIDLSSELLKEARGFHPGFEFLELDMNEIDKIDDTYDNIFLIASFHHLKTIDERINVLKNIYKLLKKNGKVFLTNWALSSDLNKDKYKQSIIENTKNKFGSIDYNIKIGKYYRFYHDFSLSELNFLFEKVGFKIFENKIFENNRNYISILEKN